VQNNKDKRIPPKELLKLFQPQNLTFSLVYEPKFIDMLNSKLQLKEGGYGKDKVPLFSIRADEPPTTYKNMQLVKLSFKCSDCDFEERISKLNIDKCMRQKKPLNAKLTKQHMLETKHKIIVKQKYEQYRYQKYPN
jgi:hypothetical protein